MLTDSEIIELEELLKWEKIYNLKKSLNDYNEKTNPNYKLLRESILSQRYETRNGKPELVDGKRGVILEGSSRSGKTWSGVDIIIWLCTEVETNCTINIYRQTYNEFKTTLYDDFKRRLDDFGLPNKFHKAEDVKSFKIGENKIFFLGDGKHGGGCDYAFYNEMMFIERHVFDQSEMRCRKFWWGDYNPSVTQHYVFDNVIPRQDVAFLRTTFADNPFISPQELSKILGYEPWEPGSYEVTPEGDLLYQGEPITEKHQPPPHPENVPAGTADEFNWKVYGLGLRGAMKGVIFPRVEWIEEFPKYMAYTYGNDFGFTSDPNVLVKYAEDEANIWIEPLIYQPIETPEELSNTFEALGLENHLPITCDSSDKYTGENKGTVEMVEGLKQLGWEAHKVRKSKSVMYWLLSMKQKKIHVVKNYLFHHAKREQENYRFKEVNGIQINQPIDDFNHLWDAARYAHIEHNQNNYQMFY